jgi:hypothetical protein
MGNFAGIHSMKQVEFIQTVTDQNEDGDVVRVWEVGERVHYQKKTNHGYQTIHGLFLFDEVEEVGDT